MSASVLLIGLALIVGQAPNEVSNADKQAFFKLLSGLEVQAAGHAAIFTEKAVKEAAPFAPVLFALTEKDLEMKEASPLLVLTWQLAGVDTARQYGIKNFGRILHPQIKRQWAFGLFQEKAAPPEIVAFLRQELEREGVEREFGLGPHFQAFKEKVILADEIAKQPKVELVKKHVQKNRFPKHGGGFDYHISNCIFAPGPLLYVARPLNNDKAGPVTGQQGELFAFDLSKGTASRRLIPQPKGFVPKHDFMHYFGSPVLSVNSRGDLLCRWTLAGNGDHAFGLLKKGADSLVVKSVVGLAIQYDSLVVSDPVGAWYLIAWRPAQYCTVYRVDEELNLTQLGKLTSKDCGEIYDGCFIANDLLHLLCNFRSVDFQLTNRKWLHPREIRSSKTPGRAYNVTVVQLKDDSLHYLWGLDGEGENANLTGVYYQAESSLESLKVCPNRHFRAIAFGNRIVVCFTLEDAPTKVFFRVIHHGTMGPVSELTIENNLDYSLWADSMQLHAEADRIWFVNTMQSDSVYELRIAEVK
ncbi:MAG: hypothetical protein K8T91_18580 [Planctomycetes bacterium]|nr:hypothetical protein [Planctomycetota bacterium]